MKRTASIDKILKPLADTPFQAYLSNAVQVADILDWILSQVGVSEIWQTSFSISEDFLRLHQKDFGVIVGQIGSFNNLGYERPEFEGLVGGLMVQNKINPRNLLLFRNEKQAS